MRPNRSPLDSLTKFFCCAFNKARYLSPLCLSFPKLKPSGGASPPFWKGGDLDGLKLGVRTSGFHSRKVLFSD